MRFLIFIIFAAQSALAAQLDKDTEPRLAIPAVERCVNVAKQHLNAGEYDSNEEQLNIIGACRNVETTLLDEIIGNLRSAESVSADKLLPVIRASSGRGVGACYQAAITRLRTQEYDSAEGTIAILKRCE